MVRVLGSRCPPELCSRMLSVCSGTASDRNVCSAPGYPCDYSRASCHQGFQPAKAQSEHTCPFPQERKALFKKKAYDDEKKTYDEQKFGSRRADGTLSSEIKSAQRSHCLSIHAETSLKSGGYKQTDRKSRIVAKNGSASKPEFELCRLDFPELRGPESSPMSVVQKPPKWGPVRSASADLSLLREVVKPAAVLSQGEIVVKNNNPKESVTANAATNSPSCTRELSWTPMGYVVRQTLSTELSPAPKNVTSMINLKTIASSADPKNVSIPSSEALSSDPSYREKHIVHPTRKSKASQGGSLEQSEASRKNKKKKEKSNPNHEVLAAPEPPRIEDTEEFPNLAVASERRDRVESPKFLSKHQPQDHLKHHVKKSQLPVQLDLGGVLAALERKQHSRLAKPASRPVVVAVGAVPVLPKEAVSGERVRRGGQVKTPHNPLDSSAPLVKRGKQREVPKAKKPTSLKKIILKERQERKQQRLHESAASPAFDSADVQEGESGGGDQAPLQAALAGPEETDESLPSPPVVAGESEEPPGAELQRGVESWPLAPSHTTFPKIHSRRFRDYCSQMLSKEVDACVADLLRELVRFQDRMYQKDPVKAKTKRRLVLGLREVLKHLKLKKLKCVIISPNCEKIQSKGGLDDTLHTIIDCACEQNIPFVFALNRKALGRSLNKAVPVSVVGIFSYDGAQDQFHRMVELTTAARQAYTAMLESAQQGLAGEPGPGAPPSPAEDGPAAPTGPEEPHYIEIWRKHLQAYSQCAPDLEESLEVSTTQMMNLNL
ncbi:selenocysteine insertion sequence-binding protein 2 [Carlito syrichta]|uniref:Selenocysteine insertion sequence-binding protein 2 n=1 Tax=Carlito syrichta TaxID=1868482 RepID=A0A1U7STL1_CARSF|nr:selenocysteine insertion sequence-binding protein 2 [Carlito syrichta]